MLQKLKERLKELNKVAVAYSGGIDSSFLLYIANQTLPKENVLAIIVNGQMVARQDYKEAIEFLKENEFNYIEIPYDALELKEFRNNDKNRCYYCKKSIMTKIKEVAKSNGFENVLDGNNFDDIKVFRPGNKAAKELQIISPLEEIGFTKQDIRKYSKECGIKFWNKPSNSCLATRFPYDTILTNESLNKVEEAEKIIKNLNIPKVRVRIYNDTARIDIDRQYFEVILNNETAIEKVKNLGFKFVTLNLFGLKSGNFDE